MTVFGSVAAPPARPLAFSASRAANSSATARWTSTRSADMQIWAGVHVRRGNATASNRVPDVGVVQDQDRILAAQLEQRGGEVPGGDLADPAADAGGPGEVDPADPAGRRSASRRWRPRPSAGGGQHIQDAGRQPGVLQDIGEEQARTASGASSPRLDHDGVCRPRAARRPARVPRISGAFHGANAATTPGGLAEGQRQARPGLSVASTSPIGVVVSAGRLTEHVRGEADVEHRPPETLPPVSRAISARRPPRRAAPAAPRRGSGSAGAATAADNRPGREGRVRRVDPPWSHRPATPPADECDDRTVGGVDVFGGPPVRRGHLLTVDE